MKLLAPLAVLFSISTEINAQSEPGKKVMDGFPPTRESQVTLSNYREFPYSQWSFRNIGGPMHMLMLPRAGAIHQYKTSTRLPVASMIIKDSAGVNKTFEDVFKNNYTNGVIVLQNNSILYEKYWNGLTRDYQHVWFSMTKSLASIAFGILMEQKKIDLNASPAQYIPELKNTPYERATVQDILNMSSALGFKENYTDTSSFFWKYYGTARDAYYVKGARDVDPMTTEVYGVYDFLAKSVTPNPNLKPGEVFEYNSSNCDVIGWMISRISGMSVIEFIRENIWARIGAEHDATMTVDRAYMGVTTSTMNTSLRDAALFGKLVLDRGKLDGKQLVPSKWIDEILKVTAGDKERYLKNDVYPKARMPWVTYKNFWWILDENKGEFAAVGTNGQVIYINRSANLVIAYFSSQPVASSAGNKNFLEKLNASRTLAKQLSLK